MTRSGSTSGSVGSILKIGLSVLSLASVAITACRPAAAATRPGLSKVIGQIAFCEVVERDVVGGGRAADQDRALLPQRMADAELVEDVGVVDRHVADDKVRLEDQAEHVLADVARLDDLAGRAAAEACGLQRGLDEGFADLLEVDFAACPIFLFSKWANDKCSLHRILPFRLTSTHALRVYDLAGRGFSRPAERLVTGGLDMGDPVHRLPERRLGVDLAAGEVEQIRKQDGQFSLNLSILADLPSRSRSSPNICRRCSTSPSTRLASPKGGNMPNTSDEAPRKIALFSGHMIDAPDRATPRFPPDKVPVAAAAIVAALADLGFGSQDLAICGGACGGDLLFAEAALARGARLELYIPFEEAIFFEKSVDFADSNWRSRFFAAKGRGVLHVAPRELGPTPDSEDPYERNNRWMLDAASRFGPDKVNFICLWNGEGGDGPGGTRHMMEEVRNRGGRAVWLETKKLWS